MCICVHIYVHMLLLRLSRFSRLPTLCDPIGSSPPGSPDPGILQAKTVEWVALSFSNAWKWKLKVKTLSHVWLSATPWTAAHQAPPSMGFSRQEYWSGVPLPSLIYIYTHTHIYLLYTNILYYKYIIFIIYFIICKYIMYINIYVCTCIYVYKYIYYKMYICIHVYMYVYVCMYINIYIYIKCI